MGIARRNPLCMSINSADKVFGHAPRERGDSPHQHEEMDNYFPCTGETHRLMRRRTKGLLFAFWLCVNDGECFLSASFAACWATPGSFQGSVCLHVPWLELRTGHAAACGHPASSTGAALGAQAFPRGEKCAPTPHPPGQCWAHPGNSLLHPTLPSRQHLITAQNKPAKELFCQHHRQPCRYCQKHWAGWYKALQSHQPSFRPQL